MKAIITVNNGDNETESIGGGSVAPGTLRASRSAPG